VSALVILPVKGLGQAKQRLDPGLEAGPRRALAEAMFSDVLVALRRSETVDEILVVTSDSAAEQIAAGHGAMLLDDSDEGHNVAALNGIRWALEHGAERVLLVPGDCPLLAPGEVDDLLSSPPQPPSAVIVPDRHGTGTNALLLDPPDALTPSFGPGSCERHAEHARRSGTEPVVVTVPSLALDVDTVEDFEALQRALASSRGGAAHTRGMLSQLSRSRT
jgi:2-phospho-L-lactate guanylyltransferase